MEIDRTTVPGTGVLYHLRAAAGTRFALVTDTAGTRRLLVYGLSGDEPVAEIVLAGHEADQLAELMRSRSVDERLARLERRLDLLTGKRVDR